MTVTPSERKAVSRTVFFQVMPVSLAGTSGGGGGSAAGRRAMPRPRAAAGANSQGRRRMRGSSQRAGWFRGRLYEAGPPLAVAPRRPDGYDTAGSPARRGTHADRLPAPAPRRYRLHLKRPPSRIGVTGLARFQPTPSSMCRPRRGAAPSTPPP